MITEKPLSQQAWRNIGFIRSLRDEEYARDLLEARRDFLRLRARSELAIRQVYIQAAGRVAEEIRGLRPTIGPLTRRHLTALEQSLRREAESIRDGVTQHARGGAEASVALGARPIDRSLLRAIEEAKVPLDALKLQRGFAEVNRAAVEALWQRTQNGLRVSDRIWNTAQDARTAMRDLVQVGVAMGRDPVKIARDLEQYVRKGAGTLAKDYPNMMARMGKRVPKDLSYEALRLARTETTKAFHEGTYSLGRANPAYRGIKWMLSDAHPLPDVCFREGTPVQTISGPKPIECIKLGELVLTHRGRWQPVMRLYRRTIPAGSLIRLRFQGENSRTHEVVLTPNHPVLTDAGWIPAADLQTGCHGLGLPSWLDGQSCHTHCGEPCRAWRGSGESAPSPPAQIASSERCGEDEQGTGGTVRTGRQDVPGPILQHTFASGIDQRVCGRPSNSGCCHEAALLISGDEHQPTGQTCRGDVCRDSGCPLPSSAHMRDCSIVGPCDSSSIQTRAHTFGRSGVSLNVRLDSTSESRSADWSHSSCGETFDRNERSGPQLGSQAFDSEQRTAYCRSGASRPVQGAQSGSLLVGVVSGTARTPSSYIHDSIRCEHGTDLILVSKEIVATRGEVVFNLGVAEDNSYFAGGVAVHNCDTLATANLYDMGPGVYPAGEEPVVPHPNCLCFPVPVLVDREDFVEKLIAWKNDPASQPELETWYNDVYRTFESPGGAARPTSVSVSPTADRAVRSLLQGAPLGDPQKLARHLLDQSGMADVPVPVRRLARDRGITEFDIVDGRFSVKQVILQEGDTRPLRYRLKTAFHEVAHARFHGLDTDYLSVLARDEWLRIEETVVEAIAHYMTEEAGVSGEIVPAYSDYLIDVLPRLKQLQEFRSASTLSDFGRILAAHRFGDSPTAKWASLKEKVDRVSHDLTEYAEQYRKYVEENLESVVSAIAENVGDQSEAMLKIIRETVESDWKATRTSGHGFMDSLVVAMMREGVR